MQEPTHAPGWRGRPRRYGPIESNSDVPAWLELLERIAPAGCVAVFLLTALLAAYMFGADWLAGHL